MAVKVDFRNFIGSDRSIVALGLFFQRRSSRVKAIDLGQRPKENSALQIPWSDADASSHCSEGAGAWQLAVRLLRTIVLLRFCAIRRKLLVILHRVIEISAISLRFFF